ncbi:MAG: hypothetical protein K6T66_01010 [Peptococcaceae bacterium]|nr:hypothetical protein [Peptococcaceae bacterium]
MSLSDILTQEEQSEYLNKYLDTEEENSKHDDEELFRAILLLADDTVNGKDNRGFSKHDKELGLKLAATIRDGNELSSSLKHEAYKLAMKYKKQLFLNHDFDAGKIPKPEHGSKDKQQEDKPTQAEILLDIAKNAELFHDEVKDAHAAFDINNHREIWPVRSKHFKLWLTGQFYKQTERAPSNEALSQSLNAIEAKGMFDGQERKLNLRVAEYKGAFAYDLADPLWRVVKITPGEWKIVDKPPIIFRRYKNTAPQVEPVRGGDLQRLLDFVNMKDPGEKLLFLVVTTSYLIPDIPHPVSVFAGEKGAAKSTTARLQRRIVDPANRELMILPADKNELALTMTTNYAPCFDNLESLQGWQSDMLCQAATGGGASKRELYSDMDEIILSFLRCPVLNGINLVATRPDLLDRSVIFTLDRITPEQRQEESIFWKKFEKERPAILGGLFNTLAKAMSIYPEVELSSLPRMADFCRWGYAISEALGVSGQTFLDAYYQNIGRANEEAISNNPVAAAVVALMNGKSKWEGTPAGLLEALEKVAEVEKINTKSKGWPQAANTLSRRLKQVKSNLLDAGIAYTVERDKSNKSRITITCDAATITNQPGYGDDIDLLPDLDF